MKSEIEAKMMNVQSSFWRERGPVMACALLTGAGLYGLLILANIPLAAFVLFALTLRLRSGQALGCPLAAGVAWWLQDRAA